MTKDVITWVWVFLGEGAIHASAVFTDRAKSEEWISKYNLTGILTAYPLDISVYDWVISNEYFMPKKEYQKDPKFIGRFSSAYAEHYHYENGKCVE